MGVPLALLPYTMARDEAVQNGANEFTYRGSRYIKSIKKNGFMVWKKSGGKNKSKPKKKKKISKGSVKGRYSRFSKK
jgi:hypothetical protein